MRRAWIGVVALLLIATSLTPAQATTIKARALLSKLPGHWEVNKGYDRAKFPHWIDADHDGCDTRAETLMIESTTKVTKTSGCTVLTGRWLSVFDKKVWTRASDVDIDHLVALAEAWGSRPGPACW